MSKVRSKPKKYDFADAFRRLAQVANLPLADPATGSAGFQCFNIPGLGVRVEHVDENGTITLPFRSLGVVPPKEFCTGMDVTIKLIEVLTAQGKITLV